MIELPEALNLARQLNAALTGKTVAAVLPPTKPHKFCWFNGDPADYAPRLRGSRVTGATGFGIYVELAFDRGQRLCVNDGVNLRLLSAPAAAKNYQLLIEFTDGTALAFSVAMYGGIVLHQEDYDNEYYLKSLAALSPFDPQFPAYYQKTLAACPPRLSMKAFLATQQRFPGLGNGVLQDILLAAGLHPKRQLHTLAPGDDEQLLQCLRQVLGEMTEAGGRDTEKDLFGAPGGYVTRLSKNTWTAGCPHCGGPITKETYLGGSVYYCPACQPPVK